jgi:hypothetical protein
VTDLPFSILMADKAAIDLALHGQSSQFVRAQRVDKIGEAASIPPAVFASSVR